MLRLLNHSDSVNWFAFGLCLLALVLTGCSYAKGAPYVVDGRLFEHDKVDAVQSGMSGDMVFSILGEPLKRNKAGDQETWSYYVWRRQDETIRYLGFIPVRKPIYEGIMEATIEFRSGIVELVSFEHRVPGS